MADRTRRRRPGPPPGQAAAGSSPATMRSLVASAEMLKARRGSMPKPENWQEEAWERWDDTPELRSAGQWYSNALSRARLVVAARGAAGDDPAPVADDDPAAAFLDDLGSQEAQSQLLAEFAPHLLVPGICYLIGRDEDPDGDGPATQTWGVFSSDEVRVHPSAEDTWQVRGDDDQWTSLPADSLVVKVWRRHARYRRRPDSQVRALLGVLRELLFLSSHVEATATSRLAGAGILAVPNEATIPVSAAATETEDPFLAELIDAMLTPIEDRSAPSAVVPILLRAPAEALAGLQHLTLDRTFDELTITLREEARRRFAAGMDMPPEVILGLGGTNHWTAWQIEESALKLHIIPMLQAVAEALTIGWLQPTLLAAQQAGAYSGPTDLVVWFDVANLQVRPDRSGDAKDLWDRDVLGDAALLRECGFDDDDLLSDDERLERRLWSIVVAAPSLAPAILPLLGVDLPEGTTVPGSPGGTVEAPAEDEAPAIGPPDTRDVPPPPPGPDDVAAAALTAAADLIVARAMERAGNRIVNRARRDEAVLAAAAMTDRCRLHTVVDAEHRCDPDELLAGSWDDVPVIAERYGFDGDAVTAALDGYARHLLDTGETHTFDELVAVLS